jgi:hypothetical protein
MVCFTRESIFFETTGHQIMVREKPEETIQGSTFKITIKANSQQRLKQLLMSNQASR